MKNTALIFCKKSAGFPLQGSTGMRVPGRCLIVLHQMETPSHGPLSESTPSLPGHCVSSHIRGPYIFIIEVEHKWLLLGVLGFRSVPYPGPGWHPRCTALPKSRREQRVLRSLFRGKQLFPGLGDGCPGLPGGGQGGGFAEGLSLLPRNPPSAQDRVGPP